MGSVFATLWANLRLLRYENFPRSIENSDFPLDAFLDRDQPAARFVQFEERCQETTSLLLAAMRLHICRLFIVHTGRYPAMRMLDEIGGTRKIRGVVEKLNTNRCRKFLVWIYWQGI